jgi:hypothetical protein
MTAAQRDSRRQKLHIPTDISVGIEGNKKSGKRK